MGWGSGSRVMGDVIKAVRRHVPDQATREAIYRPIIEGMEDEDWDTQAECLGEDPAFDAVIRRMHPEWPASDR